MRRAGINVPEELAIVSFEDISITEMVTPALTTLNNVGHQLGQLSYELLQERMSEKLGSIRPPVEKVVNAQLCLRESCGCNTSQHKMIYPTSSGKS